MVQEFQVLRCFSCQTFQVHQVKKSKKWSCKLCGEKQSLVKIYGQGSGVDCRQHVQKLNMLQGEIQQAADKTASLDWQEVSSDEELTGEKTQDVQPQASASSVSRWNKYIDQSDAEEICVKPEMESKEDKSLICEDREPLYSRRKKESLKRKCETLSHDCKFGYQHSTGFKEGACENFERQREEEDDHIAAEGEEDHIAAVKDWEKEKNPADPDWCSALERSSTFPVTMCHSDSKWGRVVSSSVTEGSQERFSLPPYVQKTEHSSIPLLQSNIEHKCKSVRTEKNLNTNMPQAAHGERFITSNEPSLNQSLFSQQQDHSKNVLVSPTTITAPSTLFQTDEDFDDNY